MTPQPQRFNRTSFITLNSTRLFTAKEVCNIIREYCPEAEPRPAPSAPEGYDSRSRAYLNGYTDGAAQAREDEINRIISILEGYRFGLDYPDCPPGDTIKSLVESLRSSSEVQE